ncbi:carboxypeptidase-like regulatory domain-containing protein [Zunongwangia sp. H14]|uniref:carboxypeptidase-like regulatory domain-containing protein n=1 Tax=Zunongwangia sp. H14 TaxID=3240792 RepID=UPI003563B7AD
MIKIVIFSFCLLFSGIAFGQEKLDGVIYSAQDSSAVFGASIYFDGTSLGVSSNKDGSFLLKKPSEITAPLVISSLGFEKLIIPALQLNSSAIPPVYLKPSEEMLTTVKIEADPWTREKKMKIFKKEFLGSSPEAEKCRIKNAKAIELSYRPSAQTLTASSEEPIIVKNRYLGYEIKYELRNFQVNFTTGSSGIQLIHSVYYDGTSFFKELKEKTTNKTLRNRDKIYKGSVLHFMRSLASKKLEENQFDIYHDRFKVAAYQFFKLTRLESLTLVELLTHKVVILYNHAKQSTLQSNGKFVIDDLGNHSPPQNLIFGGYMAAGRISHLLPLNFNLKN